MRVLAAKSAYHHGSLRRALLDATLSLIEQVGVARVSLREAAQRAGVSQTAPYRHFADKEALLAAVAEEGFRSLSAAIADALGGEGEVLDRLHAAGHAYVGFAAAHPAHYQAMFGGAVPDRSKHPSLKAAADQGPQLMREAVEAAQAAEVLRPGDPTPIVLTMYAVMHGLSRLVIDGELDRSTPDGVTAATAAVMATVDEGILAVRTRGGRR